MNRRRLGLAGTIGAPIAVACALLVVVAGRPGGAGFPGYSFGFGAGGDQPVVCPAQPPRPPLLGVSPATPWEDKLVAFDDAAQVKPRLVVSYVSFGKPFPAAHACLAVAQGGEVLVQMNPKAQTLAGIAKGVNDSYLRKFAAQIVATRAPVVFSFAHEMNGDWYPWGFGHAQPDVWIAAWRHVWNVFHAAGARVTWCWNINRYDSDNTPRVAPPAPWWPGARYVDWVGIDAYYKDPGENFGDVFASTIAAVRRFTGKPVLIAETAVGPGPRRLSQITGLFAGAARAHLVGVVWFDINRLQAWRIDGDPGALAVFRAGAAKLLEGK